MPSKKAEKKNVYVVLWYAHFWRARMVRELDSIQGCKNVLLCGDRSQQDSIQECKSCNELRSITDHWTVSTNRRPHRQSCRTAASTPHLLLPRRRRRPLRRTAARSGRALRGRRVFALGSSRPPPPSTWPASRRDLLACTAARPARRAWSPPRQTARTLSRRWPSVTNWPCSYAKPTTTIHKSIMQYILCKSVMHNCIMLSMIYTHFLHRCQICGDSWSQICSLSFGSLWSYLFNDHILVNSISQ